MPARGSRYSCFARFSNLSKSGPDPEPKSMVMGQIRALVYSLVLPSRRLGVAAGAASAARRGTTQRVSMQPKVEAPDSIEQLEESLLGASYLPDRGLATV